MTAVDDWEAVLSAAGELSPKGVDRLVSVHGERGPKAVEAVGERRVKEYRDFTVVVGHNDEDIVVTDSEPGGARFEITGVETAAE